MADLSLIVGARDELLRGWLVSTLEGGMKAVVQRAYSGWDLLRLLAVGNRTDLVIVDVELPSPSGLRTLALARTIGIEVPFILLANPADFELRTTAARLGARVLPRSLSAADLARMVRMTCRLSRPAGTPTNLH
jgi:DNA-binding response OmpR family regulator